MQALYVIAYQERQHFDRNLHFHIFKKKFWSFIVKARINWYLARIGLSPLQLYNLASLEFVFKVAQILAYTLLQVQMVVSEPRFALKLKLKVKYFKLIYFTFEVLVMSLNNRYSVYKYHEKPISQDRNQIHCLIWRNFSILLTSYLTFVFVQFALSV